MMPELETRRGRRKALERDELQDNKEPHNLASSPHRVTRNIPRAKAVAL